MTIMEEKEVKAEETEEIKDKEEAAPEAKQKPRKKRNGKKTAVIVSVVFVMAIILFIWVISQVLSDGYISIGGHSLFRVVSGSMEPELPVGTLIVSKDVDIGDIKEKDIINFKSKDQGMVGMIITHRVTGVYTDSEGNVLLETKGDANQYTDQRPVTEDNLIGKMVWRTSDGNFFATLISMLTSKVGFWAFIVFPCILFGVFIMRDTIGTLREEMDKIHRELDAVSATVNAKSEDEEKEETYEEMYDRLRSEILEELKQGAEQQQGEESEADRA